jgi:hypothetical protein
MYIKALALMPVRLWLLCAVLAGGHCCGTMDPVCPISLSTRPGTTPPSFPHRASVSCEMPRPHPQHQGHAARCTLWCPLVEFPRWPRRYATALLPV